jgi:ATP-binding cassette subfamily G (WHITE) protein 2 (SNQ2)
MTNHASSPGSHSSSGDSIVIAPIATTASRRSESTARDTERDADKTREDVRNSNPNGLLYAESGVSVDKAEEEFAELQRELSNISRLSRSRSQISRRPSIASRVSRVSRISSRKHPPPDLEKTGADYVEGEEQFDLEGTLRGSKATDEEAGIRSKRIGVVWENLTVKGQGGVTNFVRTFPDAFVSFFNVFGTVKSLLGMDKKGREVEILQDFKGVAKPGEMVLVLGRPGSGCTTFLKVIANQRYGYTSVTGDVQYGLFDAETFAKRYRGEATYNQEDDVHNPTLTVGQTLAFALDTKTPGKLPCGMTKKDFKDRVMTTILRMFNISHTRNTIVGDAWIRGISGGERKRVSIAEMMLTNSTVCCWDNSTRGLDASTALDYAKSLRVITNIYKTTTFVSLYQASESIYRHFDKVLVIDAGRQVYFGPATGARRYFEGLGFSPKPRQTTPDYLTGCTDEFERSYAPGYSTSNAPHDAAFLAASFNASSHASDLDAEIAAYRESLVDQGGRGTHEDFRVAVKEAKTSGARKKSVYSIPFHLQVWVLMKRQYLIKWQDKFSLSVSWVTSFVIALVLGTTWLSLPQTSAGAFTRGGLLFLSLLFNAFQAFGELASTMLGRPVVNKHRAYTFHRPSALWIAQIVVDMGFAAAQIMMFSLIVYWMCGLARDGGAFFTFYVMIIFGYLAMTVWFTPFSRITPRGDYGMATNSRSSSSSAPSAASAPTSTTQSSSPP